MPKGNPNPKTEHLTPFKKGQSGNPGGLSSETARLIRENAEAAARIRARLLKATEASLNERSTNDAMELIEAAMLKLLKDAEDRGLGAPVQDIRSGDGSMTPDQTGAAVNRLASMVEAIAERTQPKDAEPS